ncbi:hypothetical protein [Nonomuraea lactucae]|uniref:hypothetical protein n=1 Tax=Nonomuraea lactucae TaxID=2249762 RepID=UPI000DE383D5|nr:hypothetical protein [Nonomuraea lactucae]
MTQPPDEYGDVLRRVLRAEADTVVPSPEGLEIIRARIERRGVRNLFWWRAGAAAASALLVAGTIVMVVPPLRHGVLRDTVAGANSTSTPPAADSTNRAVSPVPPVRSQPSQVVVVPDPATRPSKPAETAKSTSKPTPSATPTPCPTVTAEPEESRDKCPTGTPKPTPKPSSTQSEPDSSATACPADACPPAEPDPTPTEIASPLVGTPLSTP